MFYKKDGQRREGGEKRRRGAGRSEKLNNKGEKQAQIGENGEYNSFGMRKKYFPKRFDGDLQETTEKDREEGG